MAIITKVYKIQSQIQLLPPIVPPKKRGGVIIQHRHVVGHFESQPLPKIADEGPLHSDLYSEFCCCVTVTINAGSVDMCLHLLCELYVESYKDTQLSSTSHQSERFLLICYIRIAQSLR